MTNTEHSEAGDTQRKSAISESALTAVEGWQTLTGIILQTPPEHAWHLAAWFRDVREKVRLAYPDAQVQPATVFLPTGADSLPSGQKEPFRLSPASAVTCPDADNLAPL